MDGMTYAAPEGYQLGNLINLVRGTIIFGMGKVMPSGHIYHSAGYLVYGNGCELLGAFPTLRKANQFAVAYTEQEYYA